MKKIKSALCAMFVTVMMLTLYAAGAAAVEFEGGDGTLNSPLQIRTEEQLLAFAARVTAAENGDEALCAVLTGNITVTSDWTAIGQNPGTYADSESPYVGTFDGAGHTIGLVNNTSTGNNTGDLYVALFHTIGTDGTVKNLNLDVDFSAQQYLAGVAVRNYGTIDYVTVDGGITVSALSGYAAGIAVYNGTKTEGDTIVPGKILHCVNKADIHTIRTFTSGALSGQERGVQQVGGICADFFGEMKYCANLGDIVIASNNSGPSGGGLFSIRSGITLSTPVDLITVSDCYNAGTMTVVAQALPSDSHGGLFGVWPTQYLLSWVEQDAIKISNTFNYGLVIGGGIIIGFGDYAGFNDSHTMAVFSNIYYLPESGSKLFGASTSKGADGYGTELVKTTIKGKTTEEFKTQDLADDLNAGRKGAEAPWEYINGNDYPTLKFERADYDPDADNANVVDKETAETISGLVAEAGLGADKEYVMAETFIAADNDTLPATLTDVLTEALTDSDSGAVDAIDFVISGDKKAYVSPEKIKELIAGDENLSKLVDADAAIISLPVVEFYITKGKTALFSYSLKNSLNLSQFDGISAGDLAIMKLTPEGLRFPVQALDFSDLADEHYIITDEKGDIVKDSDVIDGSKNYVLTVAVKDDRDYDWDKTDGHIVDPYGISARLTALPVPPPADQADAASERRCCRQWPRWPRRSS
jgi:hypothetical protein